MGFSKGLLWSIQKPGSQPSFLFGTIHMNSDSFEKYRSLFHNILLKCDAFAAEVDLDAMLALPMSDLFAIRNATGWNHLLRENQFQKLNHVCQKQYGHNLVDYHSYYPMLLIHLITLQMVGEHNSKSFDQSLWEMARQQGLSTFGLEEMEQHFNAMYNFPVIEQLKMLKKLILQSRVARKKLKLMMKYYEEEDISYLYRESKRMLGRNRKGMLYDRNKHMSDKMVETMLTQKCFFTCGAAHLYGAFGILRILKNNGFDLKPIRLSVVS